MRNLESIRLIVLDVDGTMTDGGIYIDNNGIEQKNLILKMALVLFLQNL